MLIRTGINDDLRVKLVKRGYRVKTLDRHSENLIPMAVMENDNNYEQRLSGIERTLEWKKDLTEVHGDDFCERFSSSYSII